MTKGAVDLDAPAVAFYDTIDHGQTQASAASTLGSEERFKAPAPGLFVHPCASIDDFELQSLGEPAGCRFGFPDYLSGPNGKTAALGHGINGVQNEIKQGLPNFTFIAHHDCRPR